MYIIRDREAGNIIETVNTLKEAEEIIKKYEEQDKKDDTYEEDFYEAVKADLSLIRQARHFSQSKLSELSGVNLRTLQDYEQGQKSLNGARAETVLKIAQALNCTVEDLLK